MTSRTRIVNLPYEHPPIGRMHVEPSRLSVHRRDRDLSELRSAVYSAAVRDRLPRNLDHATVTLHFRPATDLDVADVDTLAATAEPIYDALAAGTADNAGYGMCLDTAHMSTPAPVLHPAMAGYKGRLWLEITWSQG